MDVVVKEGYISHKGKLYHAGDLIHLTKGAAQKLFSAGLVEAPPAKLMQDAGADEAEPSDEEAETSDGEEQGGEELPAPDLKAMERK